MNGLLLGEDELVSAWAYETYKLYPMPVVRAIGIINQDQGFLIGAALFQNFNGSNIELSYYGPKTISSGVVRSLARVALTFPISRGTVITSKRNRRLIKGLLKVGFRLEGVQRRFYGPTDNIRNTGVRLVIFREEIEKIAKLTPSKEGVA